MVFEIKSIHCPDIQDIDNYRQVEDSPLNLFVQLFIGVRGEEGYETFNLTIVNIAWISDNIDNGIVSGMHKLVVSYFNFHEIKLHIEKLVRNCSSDSWDTFIRRFGMHAAWDMEDYIEVKQGT